MKTLLLAAASFVVPLGHSAIHYLPPKSPTTPGWTIQWVDGKTSHGHINEPLDVYNFTTYALEPSAAEEPPHYVCNHAPGQYGVITYTYTLTSTTGTTSSQIVNLNSTYGYLPEDRTASSEPARLDWEEIYANATDSLPQLTCSIHWWSKQTIHLESGPIVPTASVTVSPDTINLKPTATGDWSAQATLSVTGNKGDKLEIKSVKAPSPTRVTFGDFYNEEIEPGQSLWVYLNSDLTSFSFSEPIIIKGHTKQPGLSQYIVNISYQVI